ncbi:hypothetical protein GGF46_004941 [Coemansia sp. RSA 552]|nr:hypothetical protein GGF46_004941 [Coemansia sp. RSA 552]
MPSSPIGAASSDGGGQAAGACDTAAQESEYEEEEDYVIAALPLNAISRAQDALRSASAAADDDDAGSDSGEPPQYAIIDVDSERPLLELEGAIYQGAWDELLGTGMLFDIAADADDPEDADAKLVGTTSRVLGFHAVKFGKKRSKSANIEARLD